MGDAARKTIGTWLPPLAYVCLIFGLSSIPGTSLENTVSVHDKILHFFEYLILGWLSCRALLSLDRLSGRPLASWLLVFAFSLCLGGADELYQASVPFRDSDWMDWLADLLGGSAGGLVYLQRHRRAAGTPAELPQTP